MFQNIRINLYGLFGFILLLIMLGIRMSQVEIQGETTTNPFIIMLGRSLLDPYILATIIPYIFVSISVGSRLNSKKYVEQRLSSQEKLRFQRIYIATQIAFILAIIGLFLGMPNVLWQLIYYIIAVAAGFIASFFLVSLADDVPSTQTEKDELEF